MALTVPQTGIDFDDIACVVIATESCQLLVLNSTNFGVLAKYSLPR